MEQPNSTEPIHAVTVGDLCILATENCGVLNAVCMMMTRLTFDVTHAICTDRVISNHVTNEMDTML